jgi:RHS repeat-associated protein
VNSTYDAADELLTAGGTAFAYDGNGNQVSKTTAGTTLTYGWDALNRLISVTGGGVNTQCQYDGDGNRVSQQTSAGTYAYVNDTATTLPVVVNENGPDGNISYAYGASLISASATGLQSFYQFDGLGSVVTVTDGAASQKAGYAYDPWGAVIGGGDLLGGKNKFRFTGEAVDPGTGLVFLRARYYDPAIGKFLSRNQTSGTAEFPMSSHSYLYGIANPGRFIDRTGHDIGDMISGFFGLKNLQGQKGAALQSCYDTLDDAACHRFETGVDKEAAKSAAALAQGSTDLIYNPTTIGLASPGSDAYGLVSLPSDVKSAFSISSAGGDATGSDICIVNPYACSSPGPKVPVGYTSGSPPLLPRGPHK